MTFSVLLRKQFIIKKLKKGKRINCTIAIKKRYLESMVVLFNFELNRWRNVKLNGEINAQIEGYLT